MRTSERRGSIVVMIAMLMVVLLGFGAFAVDVSQMQAYKSELRRTADAAALAAALQLLHETQYAQAGAMAQAYVTDNPVMGDVAEIVSLEYGRSNGTAFVPLTCNPNCTTIVTPELATANAVRLEVTGSGNFYLAQILGGSSFTLNARATAWLPVAATPCAAPWGVHLSAWQSRYPGNSPGPNDLRVIPTDQKSFVLKNPETAFDTLPKWFGAINLPAVGGTVTPYSQSNGALNYAQNIFPGPPWMSLTVQPFCHRLRVGDLIQAKNGGLDVETITGLGGGGLTAMCNGLQGGSCFNVGGQIGFGVRTPILQDTVSTACGALVYPSEDDFGGVGKCFVVADVRTFVVIFGIAAGNEEGFVAGVYAGTDTAGPVRGYPQRPILVELP